ncbi:MAG: protein kinase, partial [Terriglobales bacterium]
VLASHLVATAEMRQRFEREARAISSLNHPNICILYDVGHDEGTDFLVMELLEGESLAERIKKGPLPVKDVLRYGIEIADALDKAHRQGIVHRDLKPGNVMLTKAGAKLLDFGLAKPTAMNATVGSQTAPVFSAAMTISNANSPLTAAGTIVGTMQYMAPEQIEGKEADARSDIFAFGALLYEMVTGKRAFEGKSQLSVASAILEREPEPISAIQPLSPPALGHVIERALAKDPADRWQSASDVKAELKWVSEGGSRVGTPAVVGKHRRHREWVAWGLAAVGIVAALSLGAVLAVKSSKPVTVVRSTLLPPKDVTFVPNNYALSPDGTKLAFLGDRASQPATLWVRSINSLDAQELTGTSGAAYPFWSPDSRSIGFFAGGKLKKIEAAGGPVVTLADAPTGRGAAWNRQGVILFAANPGSGLVQVSDAGGPVTPGTTLGEKDASHRFPAFLAGSDQFVFFLASKTLTGLSSASPEDKVSGIYSGKLGDKGTHFVVSADSEARAAAGQLLYINQGNLLAQPFDASRGAVTGSPVPLVERVGVSEARWKGSFSVAENGFLTFGRGTFALNTELTWMEPGGKKLGILGEKASFRHPAVSPDGKTVAVSLDSSPSKAEIWLYELARGIRTRLTFTQGVARTPIWSPDGKSVAYHEVGKGMKRKAISGFGQEEMLVESQGGAYPQGWSPDGRYLAYMGFSGGLGPRLSVYDFQEKKAKAVLKTAFPEVIPDFSPDGRWIAYSSNESGTMEIYVVPFPSVEAKFQISTTGGTQPLWAPDGKTIYYVALDGKLMAASIHTSPAFRAETARPLFESRVRQITFGFREFTITPDGRKFLVNTQVEQVENEPIHLIQNWTAELRKQ